MNPSYFLKQNALAVLDFAFFNMGRDRCIIFVRDYARYGIVGVTTFTLVPRDAFRSFDPCTDRVGSC